MHQDRGASRNIDLYGAEDTFGSASRPLRLVSMTARHYRHLFSAHVGDT